MAGEVLTRASPPELDFPVFFLPDLVPPPPPPEEQSQCTVRNHLVWYRTGLRRSAASKTLNNCGYDHAPVTRGRMRTQFPLPHGPPKKWVKSGRDVLAIIPPLNWGGWGVLQAEAEVRFLIYRHRHAWLELRFAEFRQFLG